MEQLKFSIPEIFSLIGVTQCVYVLVYIAFRAGKLSRAGLPILYFFVLGLAFLSDFGESYIKEIIDYYDHIQWFAWFYGPPLSVLLVIQIAQITQVPALRHYWVILLPPVAFVSSVFLSRNSGSMEEWLIISGLVAGAISLLAIWTKRGLFSEILAQKAGQERYWLILALMFMNIFFLGIMLAGLNPDISGQDIAIARTMVGLGFVYLVGTSLFRIYPQAVRLSDKSGLSDEEIALALKIERLMTLEKVYQEPAYSRTDLARECNTSETIISKVINEYFQKSFPQLINEHRIEDAKRLLKQTDAPVRIVAEEVGFNSLPSFNRVFKEMTSDSPSHYRKKKA